MSARSFDLWGVPFDGGATLGYPGARYAPDRIRQSLTWITQRVQDNRIFSLEADEVLELPPRFLTDRGDVAVLPHDIEASLAATSDAVAGSVARGAVPIVLGGDDSVLFGVARGLHDAIDGTVGIIHFDAHLDLLDSSPHQGRFSQSSGMRRSLELDRVSAQHSMQVGSRHFNFPSSSRFKDDVGLRHISARDAISEGPRSVVDRLLATVDGADAVFLSFDIDVVDPAYAPGCGAHEPGGLSSADALEYIRLLAPHCDALAITEVNPMIDVKDMTSTLAAYIAFHFAVASAQGRPTLDREVTA